MKLLKPNDIEKVFAILAANNPNPTTELNFKNNFELLIAVMLSAQATDKQVNKVTAILFSKATTALEMINLGLVAIEHTIKSLGLYKTKAKNVYLTCKILHDQFSGNVPQTRSELESLPGVGRKTANVVLNTAFKEPCIAVDTHVFRVAKRLGLASGNTPIAVETALLKKIPKEFLTDAHHWLILHGRYTCKARSPLCQSCELRNYCIYSKENG